MLRSLILLLFTAFVGGLSAQQPLDLIPYPASVTRGTGTFTFDADTRLRTESAAQRQVADFFTKQYARATGWDLMAPGRGRKAITVRQDTALGDEAYRLDVNADGITVDAGSLHALVYGLQTLRQLLPPAFEDSTTVTDVAWEIPQLTIEDEPRFAWRGLMLDVSRHFFPVEYIKETIDRMAFLKLNTLHWHLVDDQGWRIEIKKYPRLTEMGAWRVDQEAIAWNARETNDPAAEATYGGYYTQAEISEVVDYAWRRGITVVPEIEMPAHVMSAIAAYPWLSCTEDTIAVPSGGVWPITEIYCAGKESTFTFLENVLTEVMALFPSRYIHVGGDEATKTNWELCPHCQRRIEAEGLAGTDELQSYFIRRIERFLSELGRTLLGWDEILEGGLAPGATVMSWRGMQGGWEASKEGHDVVMTPTSHAYFDYYQGNPDYEPTAFGAFTYLNTVYGFEPTLDSMTQAQRDRVLGGQANLWSEYVPTPAHSEYMLYPRLWATAEVLWSPRSVRDWADFSTRTRRMFPRFDRMGINYAKSAYQVTMEPQVDPAAPSVSLRLASEFPDTRIRYTTDGQPVTAASPLYDGPVRLSSTATVKAVVFEDGKPVTRPTEKSYVFHEAVNARATFEPTYHQAYSGQGDVTPVNILRGSKDFHDGQWLGWLNTDVTIELDLGEAKEISSVQLGFLESQGAGIYFPTSVAVSVSEDGQTYTETGTFTRELQSAPETTIEDFGVDFPARPARYLRLRVAHGRSWLFLDEVLVR
ncbi:hexosaminidase [Neolewinella xylanilytica]|uniref:beta-N-acetylhexosaminidase n=1 Tax=Neolewinella xylanilytica TaxID=1514080 RepID=A0A2S6I8E8_9BACT|nr:glycoside hydrolase family 20 protein [Neolewinella xylanilytica]PPK87765.1 hexosaminidase [Neolewinella xylanilytica]